MNWIFGFWILVDILLAALVVIIFRSIWRKRK